MASPTASVAARALERVERAFDRAFTPRANPLHQLGALAWFFYWIVAVSGIYLYAFFDTGIEDAYASVEAITHVQWYAGGVMRSLHRYASDALLLVVMLHLVRELVRGRFRGPRWFAWVTGVPLLWLVFAAGIGGYWLVWDRLAQYVATGFTEWLDWLPLFGEPIARNFLDPSTLSDRFFTLMVFIHIAVPLVLLFGMWLHIARLSHPRVNPPRGLALGALGALVALSLVKPAVSQPPADLATVPAVVGLDWFYLALLPLRDHLPDALTWTAVLAGTAALLGVAILGRRQRDPVAEVHLDHCNGCGRCAADCPYGAVTMGPRRDGEPYPHQAVVRPELCVSCGICTGACPTATPFGRREATLAGIELPGLGVAALRERVLAASEGLREPPAGAAGRVLVYACEHGSPVPPAAGAGVVRLPCIGMLPPSFIDFAITRGHADGVLLAACREGACHHRLGIEWTRERIAGRRDPSLRARVPRERIRLVGDGSPALARALAELRGELAALGPYRRRSAPAPGDAPRLRLVSSDG